MKHNKIKKAFTSILLFFLLFAIFTPTASANSAETPQITVIVNRPPEDLTMSIQFADGSQSQAIELETETRAWEGYYRFFSSSTGYPKPSFAGATLVVQSGEYRFTCDLDESVFSTHNNLFTLDLENETLTDGQTLGRTILLISMRVLLTLLIEGIIFFLFGYRQKLSWIIFVCINLVTQGVLNYTLQGPNLSSYWIVLLLYYEVIVFIVEIAAFAILLREQSRKRAVLYALIANLASLILGGLIISYLPF